MRSTAFPLASPRICPLILCISIASPALLVTVSAVSPRRFPRSSKKSLIAIILPSSFARPGPVGYQEFPGVLIYNHYTPLSGDFNTSRRNLYFFNLKDLFGGRNRVRPATCILWPRRSYYGYKFFPGVSLCLIQIHAGNRSCLKITGISSEIMCARLFLTAC